MANYKLTNDYWETSGVYDITQGKTQREINADLKTSADSVIKPETVSGGIATFEGGEGVPLKNLTVNIEPVQTGSGDPSPENIRPISGWTSVKAVRTGKNLVGGKALCKATLKSIPNASYYEEEGRVNIASSATSVCPIVSNIFKPNTQYTFMLNLYKASAGGSNLRIWYEDETYTTIPSITEAETQELKVVVTDAGKTVSRFGKYNSSGTTRLYCNESGIFEGVLTAEEFEPFDEQNLIQIDLPSEAGTVYGGTLDVTNGTLTVDRAIVDLSTLTWSRQTATSGAYFYNNTLSLKSYAARTHPFVCSTYQTISDGSGASDVPDKSIYNAISGSTTRLCIKDSDYETVEAFSAAVSGNLVYKIAEPITYQLTPTEVKTLLGTNNIWADCGTVDVQYGAYITVVENQLGERIPKVAVAPIEKTTTASKVYAVNEMFFMGDKLYIATASIASGATFTVGTNCDETTLGEQIAALLNA